MKLYKMKHFSVIGFLLARSSCLFIYCLFEGGKWAAAGCFYGFFKVVFLFYLLNKAELTGDSASAVLGFSLVSPLELVWMRQT